MLRGTTVVRELREKEHIAAWQRGDVARGQYLWGVMAAEQLATLGMRTAYIYIGTYTTIAYTVRILILSSSIYTELLMDVIRKSLLSNWPIQ